MKTRSLLNIHAAQSLLALVILTITHTSSALEYGVFGDVVIQDTNQAIRADNNLELKFSLFLAHEFTERLSGLAEISAIDLTNDIDVHPERYWLGYEFDDKIKISLGRFHRPMGYWNRHFHHGSLLHDTIGRPFFLEFEHEENTTTSMHVIGAMATGKFSTDQGNIGYELALGNASGIDSTPKSLGSGHHFSHIEVLGADSLGDGGSMALRLTFAPWTNNFHLGVFGMHQDILEEGDLATGALVPHGQKLMEQTIIGTDFRYHSKEFEFIGEYLHFIHQNQPGLASDPSANAFYLQLSYSPRPSWKTVYRFASLNLEQQDMYFNLLGTNEQDRHNFTVRYDINEFHNLKAEVEYVQSPVDHLDDTASIMLQWSFLLR